MAEKTKAVYEPWFAKWRTTLDGESKLLNFMNNQRTAAVHVQGAKTQGDIEMMPLTQYESEFRPGNINWMVAVTLPRGIPPAEMRVMVHYFEIDGRKEKVVETCKRYVALLEKLIRDFEQDVP